MLEQSVAYHFSRASQRYDARAHWHRAVARRLCELSPLSTTRQPERILEIGCGSGFLTAELVRSFPEATIQGMDIAPEMVRLIARRFGARVDIKQCDFLTCSEQGSFDLIVSSAALQWLQPLDEALSKISALLTPGGEVWLSAFTAGTLQELHALRRDLFSANPPRQALPTSEEILSACARAGVAISKQETWRTVEEWPNFFSFVQDLRSQGFTGGGLSLGKKPLLRGELKKLEQAYCERYSQNGSVRATFEAFLLRGKK